MERTFHHFIHLTLGTISTLHSDSSFMQLSFAHIEARLCASSGLPNNKYLKVSAETYVRSHGFRKFHFFLSLWTRSDAAYSL